MLISSSGKKLLLLTACVFIAIFVVLIVFIRHLFFQPKTPTPISTVECGSADASHYANSQQSDLEIQSLRCIESALLHCDTARIHIVARLAASGSPQEITYAISRADDSTCLIDQHLGYTADAKRCRFPISAIAAAYRDYATPGNLLFAFIHLAFVTGTLPPLDGGKLICQ